MKYSGPDLPPTSPAFFTTLIKTIRQSRGLESGEQNKTEKRVLENVTCKRRLELGAVGLQDPTGSPSGICKKQVFTEYNLPKLSITNLSPFVLC